ncbi:PEP-CTERM protein-sorting domain-containing protein [Methylomagnum ishizawai]|uniref:PEP-CTERM protein-sorting domain-containing protein n=1 Tax=Methylomagnum ishizawai TaxID=1760988 RepID=A0A1Y6CZC1_9GAMM|nr:PEP-CTERM sorting domain-containing protein [Methylomagnum ishizawai]SMF93514.1 PEP-CTERM protein-sorting domain-containing protein [Methylomagnum ishizawai]
MFNRKPAYLALLAALAGASTGADALMVDNFKNPNPANDTFLNQQTDTSAWSTDDSASGAIGGYRDLYLNHPSGGSDSTFTCLSAGDSSGNCAPYIGTTGLVVYNEGAVNATAQVLWDGTNSALESGSTTPAMGLTGANLSASGAQGFYLDLNYLSAGVDLTITVWSNSGAVSASSTLHNLLDCPLSSPLCGSLYKFFSFSSFTGGAVDFADVNAIALSISGPLGYYLEATSLETRSDPGVPEPATLALTGLGLLGMGWSRRRSNARR